MKKEGNGIFSLKGYIDMKMKSSRLLTLPFNEIAHLRLPCEDCGGQLSYRSGLLLRVHLHEPSVRIINCNFDTK